MSEKSKLHLHTSLFVLLNFFGTYFITSEFLNIFIINFTNTSFTIISSVLGNLIILFLVVFIVYFIAKKSYSRMTSLTIISLILNVAGLGIWMFFKYYQTPFTINDLSFYKGADGGMVSSLSFILLTDLFYHWRIVLFVPTTVLFILLIIFKLTNKKNFYGRKQNPKVSIQRPVPIFIAILFLSLLSFAHINIGHKYAVEKWQLNHERSLYGSQTVGLYNYYLYDFLGFDWGSSPEEKKITIDDLIVYDKNVSQYTNFFGETYSNDLLTSDASTVTLSHKLGNPTSLNGIFAGKNIVYIQLESANNFFVDGSSIFLESLNLVPNFNKIINESYYFDNFYNNVGLGNTSDAETTGLTGLYTPGNKLLHWIYGNERYPRDIFFIEKLYGSDYAEMIDYEFNPLPEALGDNYFSASFHADNRFFYNRQNVHPGMFKFNEFYYFDEKPVEPRINTINAIDKFPNNIEKLPGSSWAREEELFRWVTEVAKEAVERGQNYFLYPITIHAHTPYFSNPYEPVVTSDNLNVGNVTLSYINYLQYYNDIFQAIIDMSKELTNTIYVLYADHGTGIPINDVREIIDNKEISELEIWAELSKLPAFIYAPDDESTAEVKEGLIKGRQPLVRSQIDLYRTVLELVGKNEGHFYYGVNGLSDEHTFAFQPRISLLVTDDFTVQLKKYAPNKVLSEKSIVYYQDIDYNAADLIEKIIKFKSINDHIVSNNLIVEINKKKKGHWEMSFFFDCQFYFKA